MTSTTTSTESKALALLGQGIGPETVAAAIGVTVSRISQLLSEPEFSAQVADLRYKSLAKHNERDTTYDSLEDSLLEKLKDSLPFMQRPLEILKAISVVNNAHRRGSSAPDSLVNQQTVVQLIMPTQVIQSFTTNINNQIVKTDKQDLVTVQSGSMKNLLSKFKKGAGDVYDSNAEGSITDATSS